MDPVSMVCTLTYRKGRLTCLHVCQKKLLIVELHPFL